MTKPVQFSSPIPQTEGFSAFGTKFKLALASYIKDLHTDTFRYFGDSVNMDVTIIPTSEYNSGLYYVAKVARTISNDQLSTVIVLVRESMNQVKNA